MLEPSGNGSSTTEQDNDVKKVAQAKIFCYYKALTEGCGASDCDNGYCVSSGKITALTSNEAAVKALQLFTSHAPICSSLRSPTPTNSSTPSGGSVTDLSSTASTAISSAATSSTVTSTASDTNTSSDILINAKSNPDPSNSPSSSCRDIGSSSSNSVNSINSKDPCEGGLSNELLLYTLDQCKLDQNYAKLRVLIWSAFSNDMVLRRSFPKKKLEETPIVPVVEVPAASKETSNPSDSRVEKMELDISDHSNEESISSKEKLRSSEPELEKDVDSTDVEIKSDDSIRDSSAVELMQTDDNINISIGNSGSTSSGISISSKPEDSNSDSTVIQDDQRTMPSCAKEVQVVDIPGPCEVSSDKTVAIGYNVLKSQISEPDIDFAAVQKCYAILSDVPACEYTGAMVNAQCRLLSDHLALRFRASKPRFQKDMKIIDIIIIILENPLFISDNDYTESLLEPLSEFLILLSDHQKAILVVYLAKTWSKDRLNSFLAAFHHLITIKLITTESGIGRDTDSVPYEKIICAATKSMHLLFMASVIAGEVELPLLRDMPPPTAITTAFLSASSQQHTSKSSFLPKLPEYDSLSEILGIHPLDSRKPLLPFSEFYDEFLSEQLEVDKDYAFYKSGADKFSFLHHPYILTPSTKALALYYDNRIRMFSERRLSMLMLTDGLPTTPYLKLRVRRDQLINDALVELEVVAMESPSELRKQLVVEFEGEQGIDEGGVSKEFFQLITEQLFCPDYGMFSEQKDTGLMWFNPRSFESEAQFSLVGLVLGLAIYNNIILDLRLPPVLYKKLCGKPGTFQDLERWNPTVYRSLVSLLEYEGDDMEEIFVQNFRVGYQDVFGDCLWHNLKEEGENIMVGQQNKYEFVSLYSDWLLNTMVEQQFAPFLRGFLMVTEESPLTKLFRPDELELLLCGSQFYDFNELQKCAEYDGYNVTTPVIQWFWDIVTKMSSEQQKLLLQFTTGSCRVPVGGLAHLKLVIARHGPDTDRLPTAHTCFNVLLLPEYSTKEKLNDRLMKAIQYSQGFGML